MAHAYVKSHISLHKCCYENCNKVFKSAFSLKRHEFLHKNEKNFICNVCHKNFALFQYLKEHSYIHTGELPYICGINGCTKKFRQACKLCVHRKTHQGYASKSKVKPLLPDGLFEASQSTVQEGQMEELKIPMDCKDDVNFFDFSSYFIKIRKHEQSKREKKIMFQIGHSSRKKLCKHTEETSSVSREFWAMQGLTLENVVSII